VTVDLPKIGSKIQMSLYPINLLKFFSADKKLKPPNVKSYFRSSNDSPCRFFAFKPPLGLSMILVVAKQQVKIGGKPNLKEKLRGEVTKLQPVDFTN
jgi:hypothetical protein